jgi:hypothetical protein
MNQGCEEEEEKVDAENDFVVAAGTQRTNEMDSCTKRSKERKEDTAMAVAISSML